MTNDSTTSKADEFEIDLTPEPEAAPEPEPKPVAKRAALVVEYEGRRYSLDGTRWSSPWNREDPRYYRNLVADRPDLFAEEAADLAAFDEAVRKGTILGRDGRRLTGLALQRVRDRLLGTYRGDRHASVGLGRRRVAEERRFLVQGLWPWGHIPLLAGNQKAGKTTLVADLAASLLVPGRRFLDHFEGPTDLAVPKATLPPASYDAEHDLGRGVWVVNAETPAEDFEAALAPIVGVRVTDDFGGIDAVDLLTVWHLEEHGGATSFDLTDPAVYDRWAYRLADYCETCDGSDDSTPFAVIVDGLTAILGGSTLRYAEWYAAFRRLMRASDVPNALVVGHATMAGDHGMGGVEMLGGPDGLWVYSSDSPDSPGSKRRFSVQPRLGGVVVPSTEVRLDPDGRLRMAGVSAQAASPGQAPSPSEDDDDLADAEVLADLVAAAEAGLTTTEVTGGGGDIGVRRRRARDRLAGRDEVVSRPDGRSMRWWAAKFAP